jgi:hypothetical protein
MVPESPFMFHAERSQAAPYGSEPIVRHDLAARPRGDGPPDGRGDAVLDKGGVAVAEEHVDAPGMEAAGGFPAGVVVGDAVVAVGVELSAGTCQGIQGRRASSCAGAFSAESERDGDFSTTAALSHSTNTSAVPPLNI